MTVAILAEKPSVARDLARVVGAGERHSGYLAGSGYVVTWAIGHLVRLAEPHEIRPEWKRWRPEHLPLLPERWPLVVVERVQEQFEIVRRILLDRDVERLICATDAGREGELIFRYLYEAAGCQKPVDRLWISSLTPAAIRQGLSDLRPGADYDPLADAARGRSRADWLVGMNLSRATSLMSGETLSVGRVQTPTLAMLVARELEIRNFVPEDYFKVTAHFGREEDDESVYRGDYVLDDRQEKPHRFLAKEDGEAVAKAVAERVSSGRAEAARVALQERSQLPPLLYDLTELQRHANRVYGLSAQQTLAAAQSLYESHKLITYPRTDSRHLSTDVAKTLPEIVAAIRTPYEADLVSGTGDEPLGRRYVDDKKVSDHHAILPTANHRSRSLKSDEEKVYDLVCRRLLMAWQPPHRSAVTTVWTRVLSAEATDWFRSQGTLVLEPGWKRLDLQRPAATDSKGRAAEDADEGLPSWLEEGLEVVVVDSEAQARQTQPPRRLTEATLLTAMETAGKTLDDRQLSEAMRERGLGTPATRAEIIETLLRRKYAVRQGKALVATDRGIRLIDEVHEGVKTPAMTAEWEADLKAIEKGSQELEPFLESIERYVTEVVGETLSRAGRPTTDRVVASQTDRAQRSEPPAKGGTSPPSSRREGDSAQKGSPGAAQRNAPRATAELMRPRANGDLSEVLSRRFGFAAYRPFQEPVCREAAQGRDVLLVMPTGAGKSLCYQLPGLARAGTTLVISPLIALMEDQVAKLKAQGIAAERIHSGRSRTDSRQVCRQFLDGELEFLYIAPERLGVAGFPELLARRRPSLVAIDEAHCISHWGHDFRPDYRLLGQRLPSLRPAPFVALTATATPRVQKDIVQQLGLDGVAKHIHGFRRDNLGIEVVEMKPSARGAVVDGMLAAEGRRPALVYSPTRRDAEELAALLSINFQAAAYHAGLSSAERDRVQTEFLAGTLEVIVATIAFGMGVDKPDIRTVVHTGLPGSVEGYYQEIGRAGRDGEPSRAVLLYSWADRKTHEFFFENDYPPPQELARLHQQIRSGATRKGVLATMLGWPDDQLQAAVEKLRIHGGVAVAADGSLCALDGDWRRSYSAQRDHRQEQIEQVTRFAKGHRCRMLQLVEHFGDQEDSGESCGRCDICSPEQSLVLRYRSLNADEQQAVSTLLTALRRRDGIGTGTLWKQVQEVHGWLERGDFEGLLAAAVRAELVEVKQDSFVKNGREVRFQRARLLRQGRRGDLEQLAESLHIVDDSVPPAEAKKKGSGRRRSTKPSRVGSVAAGATTAATEKPDAAAAPLVEALKAWRREEAKRQSLPAYCVFPNKTLEAIATARPRDRRSLLDVSGVGDVLADRYGEAVLDLVARMSD